MAINRREFIKTTALGTATLALTPSFSNLLAAPAHAAAVRGTAGFPHRFVFIRKSNGNLVSQFGLPSFNQEQQKMEMILGMYVICTSGMTHKYHYKGLL